MKKMLIMLNSLNQGGVEKACLNLLQELEKTDWEITLLLVKMEGVFIDEVPADVTVLQVEMPENIRDEITMPTTAIAGKYVRKLQCVNLVKLLYGYVKRHGKDMNQIMENYFERYDKCVPEIKEKFDVAIDYQGQGSFPTYFVERKVNAKRKLSWIHNDFSVVDYPMEWLEALYAKYEKIISVSQKAQVSFLEKFPQMQCKADVCYNVVPYKQIMQESRVFSVPSEEGINIVTVGRLSYQKGYDIALQVVAKLDKEGYPIHYHMVGEGEQRSELENLVEQLGLREKVHMHGWQCNPYPFILMCDIYLQPSRFEGYCITLAEAKILRKVIITTDFAGADEQITNDVNGIIVKCDEENLYQGLKRVIEDKKLRDGFAEALSKVDVNQGIDQFKLLIDK